VDKRVIPIVIGDVLFTIGMTILVISSIVGVLIQIYGFIESLLDSGATPLSICGLFIVLSLLLLVLSKSLKKLGEELYKR